MTAASTASLCTMLLGPSFAVICLDCMLLLLLASSQCSADQSSQNAEMQRVRVLQEVGAMLRVQHHPHAVKLLDVFEDTKAYQLVMPLLKGARKRAKHSSVWASAICATDSSYHPQVVMQGYRCNDCVVFSASGNGQ